MQPATGSSEVAQVAGGLRDREVLALYDLGVARGAAQLLAAA
jgi:hypothetical protein